MEENKKYEVRSSSEVWEEDFWESTDVFEDQLEAEKYIVGLPKDYRVQLVQVTQEENCVLRDKIFEGKAGNLLTGNSD